MLGLPFSGCRSRDLMLSLLPNSWHVPFRVFWHHCWRGLLVGVGFAAITIASLQNALSMRVATQQIAPARSPDAWKLSAQALNTYADELAHVAFSADRDQRVQASERIKAIISNCESEIYRLQHASNVRPEEGVLSLDHMQHLFARAQVEAMNLIQLPSNASVERRSLQAVMLTQSIASIHTSLSECMEARAAVRAGVHAVALKDSLRHADWEWPVTLGMAGLFATLCGIAMDWQTLQHRQGQVCAEDTEYSHDLAMDSPVGIMAIDPAGQLRWINTAGAEMLQTSRGAVIGSSFLQYIVDTDRMSDFQARLQSGESLAAYSMSLRTASGAEVDVLLDGTACLKRGYLSHMRCVLLDVTGRLQAEQAYRASERRLTAVVNNSPTGMLLTDNSGACTFVNQKWCELTGMSAERGAGTGWVDALHPHDRERTLAEWERFTTTGVEFQTEFRFVKPDGSTVWISSLAVALRNEARQITQFLVNVTDVTQLKLTERSFAQKQMYLRAILDSASDGIAVINEQGIIESANPAVRSLFGYQETELIGQNIARLVPDSHRDEHDSDLRLLTTDEHQFVGGKRREVIGVRKDGCQFPLELSVSVMQTGSSPRLMTCILHDISERKAVEERLQRSEERFELAVRGSNDVVLDWNFLTDEIYHSPRLAELLGYELDEIQSTKRWLFRLIHPRDRLLTQAALEKHLKTDVQYNVEHRVRAKSGQYHWFNSRGRVVRDGTGRPIRMVGTTSDITTQKQQEQALLQYASQIEESRSEIQRQSVKLSEQSAMLRCANESAQAASEAKGRFLANMSHEIRTPLNSILGMTELALDGELPDEQRELIGTIHSSGEHLLSLVNDILDFSKIEAGKLKLELAPFVVRDFVQRTIEMLQWSADNKGLALKADVAEHVPAMLVGDASRLRQILLNLVGNAIKFTPHGEVSISVRLAHAGGSSPVWWFTVHDTGIGIPEDKLASVFRPFEQGDTSTTRKFGGTGLGLSIVKALVELMQGRVWVESEVGQGSRFHFEVKLFANVANSVASSTSASHCSPLSRALNILVAEDNAANQRLVRMLLQKQGHTVTLVDDGLSAVNAAKSRNFDLILMDMQMPHLNGVEATVCIRQAERAGNLRPVPIIALTANVMHGDREECFEAGMNGYATKPIRREELYGEIDRVILGRSASLSPAVHMERIDTQPDSKVELVPR